MSEPTEAEKEATKARIRAALDVLEKYVGADGKIDATKMTTRLRELEAERDAYRRATWIEEKLKYEALAETDELRAENVKLLMEAAETWALVLNHEGRIERLTEALRACHPVINEAIDRLGCGCQELLCRTCKDTETKLYEARRLTEEALK